MQAIANGLDIHARSLKETAFVERAISHYTRFLQGDPEVLGSLTGELKEQIQGLRQKQQVSFNVAQIAAENTYDLAQEMEQVRAQLQAAEQERDLAQKKNRELEQHIAFTTFHLSVRIVGPWHLLFRMKAAQSSSTLRYS